MTQPTDNSLDELRRQLDAVDAALIQSVAARQSIVARIGALKQARGQPLRDYQRERVVIDGVRERATELGLAPDLAQAVMMQLIESSLTAQEQQRWRARNDGVGRRALVIGGAGRMGGWFCDFLIAQGYVVAVRDPLLGALPAVAEQLESVELIVVAAPLAVSAQALIELAELRPDALVFDIGSIKAPLRPGLAACAAAGLKVCSVHPMFGPDAQLLAGRQVLFMDVGGPSQALDDARALFAATSAELIDIDLAEHDLLMSVVLGLAHATSVVFGRTLAQLQPKAADLAIGGSTFARQLALSGRVLNENPALYFEIQHLNPTQAALLGQLESVCAALKAEVEAGDREGFVAAFMAARVALEARNAGR